MNRNDLHSDAIVIDAVCPLAKHGGYLDLYKTGGCTAIAPTVGGDSGSAKTFGQLGRWLQLISGRPDLVLIRRADDILSAKKNDQLGIIFHFQGTEPVEADLDLVDAYKEVGVGVIQLAYNVKNRVGDGCEERTDCGLSRFGLKLIERMNESKILVDCSHTGYRTTMDAMTTSSAPVVFSHANAFDVHPSPRNIKKDQMRALAATGGVIGVVAFSPFVSQSQESSLDEMIDHISYYADNIGIDHVALGLDYFEGQRGISDDSVAEKIYRANANIGRWGESYPAPPYYYASGVETPDKLPNLTSRLQERGFLEADIRKVLGENWMRVYRCVWG